MTSTNYDLVINGVKARIAQGEEGGGYKRRSVRREVQNQIISQAESPAYRNRDDGVALLQTSWAGGARWWKPLITPQDLSSYFQSNHLDSWSEPGKVVPSNLRYDSSYTILHDNIVIASDGDDVYAIGDTTTTDATQRDVYKWANGSNTFVRETTYSSGIQDDSNPIGMVYDSTDGYFYVLAETAAGALEIGRFNPTTPDEDLSWFTEAGVAAYGSDIVVTQYGLFYTTGGAVKQITKSGPTATDRFDPGTVELLARSNTNKVAHAPLLLSTPQGIYLIRNAMDTGVPVPTIYRIDRDVSGSYVGNPIAQLTRGSVALSAIFHLGQLLVATTPNWQDLNAGDKHLEVVIYFVGEGGIGALGSVLGNRLQKDETPYRFLGAEGANIYLAGAKRLWLFDAVRGGLHTVWTWDTAVEAGGYKAMARLTNSAGREETHFFAKDRINYGQSGATVDPDIVTAFGDDETYYTLESNFFDGGLPMEVKEITEVSILRDKDDGGSEWTVQVAADDGSFADILVSAGTSVFDKATTSGVTGYQFRYKLIYQTKDATRSALRSVLVTMTTGDMITEWDVLLDGTELLNMDNQRQDPKVFADSMVALGANASIVALIDNYSHLRDEDISGTGTNVKVVAVEIVKDTPGESVVRVLLREA